MFRIRKRSSRRAGSVPQNKNGFSVDNSIDNKKAGAVVVLALLSYGPHFYASIPVYSGFSWHHDRSIEEHLKRDAVSWKLFTVKYSHASVKASDGRMHISFCIYCFILEKVARLQQLINIDCIHIFLSPGLLPGRGGVVWFMLSLSSGHIILL